MTRFRLSTCLALSFVFLALAGATAASAASITYPGSKLRSDPLGLHKKSLYPTGAASGNTVTVKSGTIGGMAYGGVADSGNSQNNTVNVKGGTISHGIYGGSTDNGNAVGNTVTIKGGKVTGDIVGGDTTRGASTGNRVCIFGGTVKSMVIGGYVDKDNGTITGNNVTVSGKANIRGELHGGYSDGLGATVSGNSVTIKAGTVKAAVYGGFSGQGEVWGNMVSISGGKVKGNIIGGYVGKGEATALDNSVILSGSPNLKEATLYGGYRKTAGSGDILSGNTLYVKGFSGSVKGLYNFGHMDFILPKNVKNGSAILSVNGKKAANISSTIVSLEGFAKGAKALKKGNTITLIKKTSGKPFDFYGANVRRGASELYDFSLVNDSKNLVVKVDAVRKNSKSAAFAKDRAESLDLLTRGADRLAEQTMHAVRLNAGLAAGMGGGLFMFGDSSASMPGVSWSSEGKVSSSLAGLGFSSATAYGTLAFGSFFESGWTEQYAQGASAFDSAALRDREQSSYGSGLLARFDHTSGLYAEGALRYGKAQSNFSSDSLRDGFGNRAAYDTGTHYTSFHTGLGHVYSFNESLSVESYSKLFVTRLQGNSTDVLGDRLNFKDSESRRIRSGAKFSFELDERFSAFAGLAHEYEANGKIQAELAGYNLERDSARGHSAMFQAGFSFRPTQDLPLSLYMDYRGYAGARQDTNASAGVMFEF